MNQSVLNSVRLCVCLVIVTVSGLCLAENPGGPVAVERNTAVSEKETGIMSQAAPEPPISELARFKALVKKTGLTHIFEKGGPIMWPLLLASVLAMGTVIERIFFLFIEWCRRDRKAIQQFFKAIQQADIPQAIQISEKSKFYVVQVLGYALTHRGKSLANALLYAREEEIKRFRRGIPILDTVITLAPLLGLLGTVTGMMGSFSLIGGELSAPGAITGGIAEALIATAFGLGIAITSLIPFNFLNTKMEQADLEMESAATQLELLIQPPKKTTGPHASNIDVTGELQEFVQSI